MLPQDLTQKIALAPQVQVNKVATFRDLDQDLLKHSAFTTLDNEIDLKLLAKGLLWRVRERGRWRFIGSTSLRDRSARIPSRTIILQGCVSSVVCLSPNLNIRYRAEILYGALF